MDSIKVVRGIKAVEGDKGHTDAIIGMFALEAFRLTEGRVKDTPKIVSVGLDNSLRVWDPEDLSCLQVLQSGTGNNNSSGSNNGNGNYGSYGNNGKKGKGMMNEG